MCFSKLNLFFYFNRSLIQGAIATIKRAVKKKGANDIDVSTYCVKNYDFVQFTLIPFYLLNSNHFCTRFFFADKPETRG